MSDYLSTVNPDDLSPEARIWLERVQRHRRDNPDALRSPDIHPTRRRTDPQPDPRTDHEQPDLLGEGVAPKPWPQAAPAPAEPQQVMPLEGTNERKYRTWRATDTGDRIYQAIRGRAVTEAAQGASRIAVKRIAEIIRAQFKTPINNTLVAFIAAELADEPTLAPLIERRQRKSA